MSKALALGEKNECCEDWYVWEFGAGNKNKEEMETSTTKGGFLLSSVICVEKGQRCSGID